MKRFAMIGLSVLAIDWAAPAMAQHDHLAQQVQALQAQIQALQAQLAAVRANPVLALGPYREGLSLRPESRAAIERAPKSPIGIPVRDVSCTLADAADMLDYFRSAADVLTTLGKDGAPACARAFLGRHGPLARFTRTGTDEESSDH